MNLTVFALILFSVFLSATAQIVLKTGMSQPAISAAMAGGDPLAIALQLLQSPGVIGGLGLYFLGAVAWLFVLARVEVSYAYPFVGIGFILTMLFGKFLLGDSIGAARMVGTLLVTSGVVLIARS